MTAVSARGATLVELLVALMLALVAAAGLAIVAGDARAVFVSQPEASDLLQRARVSLDWMARDLGEAGGGPWRTRDSGPLMRWVPPMHPRRLGPVDADEEDEAFSDRITVLSAADEAPQAEVGDMGAADVPAPLLPGPWCPPGDPGCGFAAGAHVLIVDATGAFETFVAAGVAPGLLLPSVPTLSKAYVARERARVVGVRAATYYLDARRRQLRRYDGLRSDVPVADEVIALRLRYFGDVFPPDEPRPPPGEENCVIDRAGMPRLPPLVADHGTLIELTPAMLRDGPWCGVSPQRFDADLYRVRQVQVTLRVQAEAAAARGVDPVRFVNAGLAREPRAEVPDLELRVDITPRNLQRW
jgi:type II secretory pathway pseudopilin PulG